MQFAHLALGQYDTKARHRTEERSELSRFITQLEIESLPPALFFRLHRNMQYTMYAALVFIFLTQAAHAEEVKPANISDIAGDYRLLKEDAAFCTPNMQLWTSGTEITALKFEDYPLKCNLPWNLIYWNFTAEDEKSSTFGRYVRAEGDKTCSGTTLWLKGFRALRDHDYWLVRASNPVRVNKGNFYLDLATRNPTGRGGPRMGGSCLYRKNTTTASRGAPAHDRQIHPPGELNSTLNANNGSSGANVSPKLWSQKEGARLSPEVTAAIISSLVGLIGVITAALIGVYCLQRSKQRNDINDNILSQ